MLGFFDEISGSFRKKKTPVKGAYHQRKKKDWFQSGVAYASDGPVGL